MSDAGLLEIVLAVLLVSMMSLIGVVFLATKEEILNGILSELVAFATGTLLGASFLHMIPEALESLGVMALRLVIVGILFFFILERFLYWRHCHKRECETHTFVYMNLVGDAVHNFVDGLVIAASFMTGTGLGITATLAIIVHEIPQEIGDFAVLVYGGLPRNRALFYNLISALTAVIGGVVGYSIHMYAMEFSLMLIPFAAGGFIYIAGADLMPEIHKERNPLRTISQLVALLIGIAIIYFLT